jgi:hypothetical protein
MAARGTIGPVDPERDEAVAALDDTRLSSAALLRRVWMLDGAARH